jgi:hypothetical protein
MVVGKKSGVVVCSSNFEVGLGLFLAVKFFFFETNENKKKILFFCDIKIGEEFGCDYSLFRC